MSLLSSFLLFSEIRALHNVLEQQSVILGQLVNNLSASSTSTTTTVSPDLSNSTPTVLQVMPFLYGLVAATFFTCIFDIMSHHYLTDLLISNMPVLDCINNRYSELATMQTVNHEVILKYLTAILSTATLVQRLTTRSAPDRHLHFDRDNTFSVDGGAFPLS